MNTNQKIAGVYLTSKFRQLLVAVLSVTFGISMYIFMNGFMSGVNNTQSDITFTSMSHIKIYNDLEEETPAILPIPTNDSTIRIISNAHTIQYTEGIKNTKPIIEALQDFPDTTGVTEQVNQTVFLRNGIIQQNASLSGVEVASEDQLFGTSKYMTEGNFFDLEKRSDGIILGTKLAKNLGVGMGNNVQLMTSSGLTKVYKIIGLYETGSSTVDKTKAIVSIRAARQLFSKNKNYATEILVNINDYNKARSVAQELAAITSYKVEPWMEGNSQLESANVLRDILAVAVSLTILIVAGFGIYNIMSMTVNEKIKEIAILKAMGYNGKDIVEIFLTESLVIGFIGGISGMILGNIVSRIIAKVPFKIATFSTLPMDFKTSDYVLAFLFGIIITLIAGYFPARKASKVDPVEIIRG